MNFPEEKTRIKQPANSRQPFAGIIFSIIVLLIMGLFAPSLAYATGTSTVIVSPNRVPVNIDFDFIGQETPKPNFCSTFRVTD